MQWTDRSTEIDKIAPALVAALAIPAHMTKNKTADTGSYSYRYVDLAAVMAHSRQVLKVHGLCVMQSASTEGDEVLISTTILHESGQFLTVAPLRLPMGKTAQQAGSAITYARRYALTALLGIVADDDDDGAKASEVVRHRADRPAPKKAAEPRTEEEAEIRALLASIPATASALIRGQFKARFGSGLSDLDPSQHADALEWTVGTVSEWEHQQATAS